MNIIDLVEGILNAYNIKHEMLRIDRSSNRHTHISDHKYVFVKMMGTGISEEDFYADVAFNVHNRRQGFELLIPQVVRPVVPGLEVQFSVWKYSACKPLTTNTLTRATASAAAQALHLVHRTPYYEDLSYRTSDLYERFGSRLNTIQFKSLNGKTQNQVRAFYEKVANPAIRLTGPPMYKPVVNHGNAKPNKLALYDDNTIRWNDFSRARLTHAEYDLGALKFHLYTTNQNPQAWEAFYQTYKELNPSVDDSLLDLFVGLAAVDTLAELITRVISAEKEDELHEYMRAITPLLKRQPPLHINLPYNL